MNIFKTFVREKYIGGLIVGIFIFGTPPFVGFDTVVMFNSLYSLPLYYPDENNLFNNQNYFWRSVPLLDYVMG